MDTLKMLMDYCKRTKCDACDFLDDGLCKFFYENPEDWPDPDYVRQVIESEMEVNHGTEIVSARPGE